MFNLETSIQEWRRQMHAAGIHSAATLTELESHLREEVERQKTAGLPEPQAFATAREQMGPAAKLQAEFQKTTGTKFYTPLLGRAVFAGALLLFGLARLMGLRTFLNTTLSPQWLWAGWLAIASLAVVAVVLLGWPWSHRLFPAIASQRTRTGLGAGFGLIALIGGFGLRNFILPAYDFTVSQLLVLILWGLTLLVLLAVLLAGFAAAAQTKSRT